MDWLGTLNYGRSMFLYKTCSVKGIVPEHMAGKILVVFFFTDKIPLPKAKMSRKNSLRLCSY
jgi:hypothetical protein